MASATISTNRAARSRRSDSRFYFAMGLLAVGICRAGFVPALFKSDRNASWTWMVAVHAVLFGFWLLVFLLQVALVSQRRIRTHRKLGYAAALLAMAMVVSGYLTAIAMVRRGFDLSGDLNTAADPFGAPVVFQLGDTLSFALLVGAAVIVRNRPQAHKRLILLATLGSLLPAPLAHLLSHFPQFDDMGPIILLPLLMLYSASAVHDKLTYGRIHPVSLWVPVALFIWANLRAVVIGPSETFHQFVEWLARQ